MSFSRNGPGVALILQSQVSADSFRLWICLTGVSKNPDAQTRRELQIKYDEIFARYDERCPTRLPTRPRPSTGVF